MNRAQAHQAAFDTFLDARRAARKAAEAQERWDTPPARPVEDDYDDVDDLVDPPVATWLNISRRFSEIGASLASLADGDYPLTTSTQSVGDFFAAYHTVEGDHGESHD